MQVINARNVNYAFRKGIDLLLKVGERQESRAGPVLVVPDTVTTVYERPLERVLFHEGRDANPFFHLAEALWILAGRNDARWLDVFVSDFSSRFAEYDGLQHGAYGYRWRKHFDIEGGGDGKWLPDQLNTIVELLQKNPKDRRIVLTMWDPVADLGADKRDIPCNSHAYFRVRDEIRAYGTEGPSPPVYDTVSVLDLTVCCRSNDAIWGAYGANAVHFSFLQEYMAARLGMKVGRYEQVSFNFHAYCNVLDKIDMTDGSRDYYEELPLAKSSPLAGACPQDLDLDLSQYVSDHWDMVRSYRNAFFHNVAVPMRLAHNSWRLKDKDTAKHYLRQMPVDNDWRVAAEQWIQRRIDRAAQKKVGVNVG